MSSGYIRNCILVCRDGDGALFSADGTPYLDGYAVIPLEVFKEMGGTKHKAYKEFIANKPVAKDVDGPNLGSPASVSAC